MTLVAAIVVGVGIAVSSAGSPRHSTGAAAARTPSSAAARSQAAAVQRLLAGIPQHGMTLGDAHAPVTLTEYGDLECSVCDDFALDGSESRLIAHNVRSGHVKLVYRSLETATEGQGADASRIFTRQQSAAGAAGAQRKAWNYILLFYHEQGAEGTPYVTPAYLTGLARQIPGIDLAEWQTDRFASRYAAQITGDARRFGALGVRQATPTLIASGPHGRTRPVQYAAPYGVVESMIDAVS